VGLFEPIIEQLNNNGVRYVVVGGVAVVLHGYARLTADLDLAVDLSTEEARKAIDSRGLGGAPPRTADAGSGCHARPASGLAPRDDPPGPSNRCPPAVTPRDCRAGGLSGRSYGLEAARIYRVGDAEPIARWSNETTPLKASHVKLRIREERAVTRLSKR
jgi:hypothetical protein